MKLLKYCLVLLFTVRVYIPFAKDVIFHNVKEVTPYERYYKIILKNDKTVYVPMMVTVIEEE